MRFLENHRVCQIDSQYFKVYDVFLFRFKTYFSKHRKKAELPTSSE